MAHELAQHPIRLTLDAAVRWAEKHIPEALDLPEPKFLMAANAHLRKCGLPSFELVKGPRQ